MASPIIMAFEPGESFSSINTITVGGGIAWGECLLAYRNLDFSRGALDEAACFVGCNTDQEIFDQYCRLDHDRRERIHLPRRTFTRPVRGISVGVSASGALDIFDGIGDLVRPLFRELISNTIGMVGLTTGTAGGFMNMFDAGAFHGMNGNTDFSIDMERFSTYQCCMVQLGVGAFVAAAVNILYMGDFRNMYFHITNEMNVLEKIAGLMSYLADVIHHGQCYAVVGEASAGLILPGGSVNVVGS